MTITALPRHLHSATAPRLLRGPQGISTWFLPGAWRALSHQSQIVYQWFCLRSPSLLPRMQLSCTRSTGCCWWGWATSPAPLFSGGSSYRATGADIDTSLHSLRNLSPLYQSCSIPQKRSPLPRGVHNLGSATSGPNLTGESLVY